MCRAQPAEFQAASRINLNDFWMHYNLELARRKADVAGKYLRGETI
jgi:hypothetical protein